MNQRQRLSTFAVGNLLLWTLGGAALAAEPRVEMTLGTEPGFPATNLRVWTQTLTALNIENLQIRGAVANDKIEIVTRGTAAVPLYSVSGIITQNNQLIVPGGRFSANDRAGLSSWLEKLRKEGPARAGGAPREPFGLPVQVRALVNGDLARTFDFPTKGQPTKGTVEKLATKLAYPLLADPAARTALADAGNIDDELQGLAVGTAIVALARTAGYVVVPRVGAQGKPEYLLTPVASATESWPLGWTPAQKDGDIVPALIEIINVQIDDTPVAEVVEAIAGKLKIPVVYDRAIMAHQKIDIMRTKTTIPEGKSMCAIVLRRALFKAGLTHELRLDDAGKPMLWITSVKP